jgi:hypothetical protein
MLKKMGGGKSPRFFCVGNGGIVVFFEEKMREGFCFFDVGWTKMAGKTSIGV